MILGQNIPEEAQSHDPLSEYSGRGSVKSSSIRIFLKRLCHMILCQDIPEEAVSHDPLSGYS